MIEFGATVNDETRRVYISDTDLPDWVVESVKVGADTEDLDAIEAHVMNIEHYYREFYDGATDADYDAALDDTYAEWTDE